MTRWSAGADCSKYEQQPPEMPSRHARIIVRLTVPRVWRKWELSPCIRNVWLCAILCLADSHFRHWCSQCILHIFGFKTKTASVFPRLSGRTSSSKSRVSFILHALVSHSQPRVLWVDSAEDDIKRPLRYSPMHFFRARDASCKSTNRRDATTYVAESTRPETGGRATAACWRTDWQMAIARACTHAERLSPTVGDPSLVVATVRRLPVLTARAGRPKDKAKKKTNRSGH